MKALYDNSTTLQTHTRVVLEANYNRTVKSMTRTGDVLYYKAPDDPAEHPMYVDAEGRIVPVSADTLQPMTNGSGQVVDRNGTLVPPYDTLGYGVHIDDVRIAVTSSEYEVTDEEGKEIFIAHDGEIIPTGDNGIPNTTLVGGVPWAIGADGEPHAPLSRVFTLRSHARPVRAENVPVDKSGNILEAAEDQYPEYFDIESIVKSNRPERRGALVAWTADDIYDYPTTAGTSGYNGARFYTADKDAIYKYWTSPTTSDATGVLTGSTVSVFDTNWTLTNATSRQNLSNQITANYTSSDYNNPGYLQRILTLDHESSYEMSFSALAQSQAVLDVELIEWSDDQTSNPNFDSASLLGRTLLTSRVLPAGAQIDLNLNITPKSFSKTHVIRLSVRRAGTVATPSVSFMNFSLRKVSYPIASVGPRAVYDRPVATNKIVIGIDYSVDDNTAGEDAYVNKPNDSAVRVFVDRGDGLFTWQTIATNPEIDSDGKITLLYNGSWGSNLDPDSTVQVMGVQYVVFGMKRRDARVNVMEISARRVYDVSEHLSSYEIDSDAAENSFVLAFGTTNSNNGTLRLSNNDGRFNSANRYLLDTDRLYGQQVFTTQPNPFYQMLNDSVDLIIETATFAPGDASREYLRMITARTDSNTSIGNEMVADLPFYDNARLLDGIKPLQTFYHLDTMSIIQAFYMLLDSVGFTSVIFSDEDEHFSTHLKYFWTTKEGESVWAMISKLCQATQTVAFFDEYNRLNFKSLKGLYHSALATSPALLLTTEDVNGVKANIKDMKLDESVFANQVNVNYREVTAPEKTPSGVTPMEVVWEPEGTQVLRAAPLTHDLNNKQVGQGGTTHMRFPFGVTKTWPFAGMVQVEGELIKYDAKEYKWHTAEGKAVYSWVTNDDERKEFDSRNEYLALTNAYSGALRITERGAENTAIKAHVIDPLPGLMKVRKGDAVTNNPSGISVNKSKLRIQMSSGSGSAATISVTEGSWYDTRPDFIGTRLNIKSGAHAGVCFGMTAPNEDGIFVEVTTTEGAEQSGRTLNELHVFVRKNGSIKYYGAGVPLPVSKNKEYDLDVAIQRGVWDTMSGIKNYSKYYSVVLQYGNRGNNVKTLQTALNNKGEKLTVDGSFGQATRNAVLRLQQRAALTKDGIVRIEEWKALEYGAYNPNMMGIIATVDGTYQHYVQIASAELPTNWNDGRYGVFARGVTHAEFEHLYAMKGSEDVEYDETQFFDWVRGGYVSDQMDARWIYDTKTRYISTKQGTVTRQAVNNQLLIHDFGPYAHEVRDYEVEFNDDTPALSSYLYSSNESQIHLTDYTHKPFGAKFRVVNKARHDAVMDGEDSVTFGSENTVDQKMMIYGSRLKVNDERSLTVTDKTSVSARGLEEITLDMDWIQSEESAKKLGSHIIEAMSGGARTYSADIFGNASVRVGQVVSVYNPQIGLGDAVNPELSNRLFVYGVSHNNGGGHQTSVTLREVIGSGGFKNVKLRDVYERNNNAMNMNPDVESYTLSGGIYVPSGYDFRAGANVKFASPLVGTQQGGGAAMIYGTGTTPYQTSMLANPFPDGTGRFSHSVGDYYLAHVNVTGLTNAAVALVIEGWPTSGSMTKALASKTIKVAKGETVDLVLKGRFMVDGSIPELEVGVRLLDPVETNNGGKASHGILVNSFYYRSSQNEEDIYPLYGGENLRKP